jgi:hypothetical protein
MSIMLQTRFAISRLKTAEGRYNMSAVSFELRKELYLPTGCSKVSKIHMIYRNIARLFIETSEEWGSIHYRY